MWAGEFSKWEESHQDGLRKLVSLFDDLKYYTRSMKFKSAVLRYRKEVRELELYEMDREGKILSDEMLGRFWGGN